MYVYINHAQSTEECAVAIKPILAKPSVMQRLGGVSIINHQISLTLQNIQRAI